MQYYKSYIINLYAAYWQKIPVRKPKVTSLPWCSFRSRRAVQAIDRKGDSASRGASGPRLVKSLSNQEKDLLAGENVTFL